MHSLGSGYRNAAQALLNPNENRDWLATGRWQAGLTVVGVGILH